MHLNAIDPIVYRIEIDSKKPLKTGDKYSVQFIVERKLKLKFIFNQPNFKNNDILMLKAKVVRIFFKNERSIGDLQNVIVALTI